MAQACIATTASAIFSGVSAISAAVGVGMAWKGFFAKDAEYKKRRTDEEKSRFWNQFDQYTGPVSVGYIIGRMCLDEQQVEKMCKWYLEKLMQTGGHPISETAHKMIAARSQALATFRSETKPALEQLGLPVTPTVDKPKS